MPFEEDLTLFLDLDGFAFPAQATTRFREVVSFQVIFDNGYAGALGDRLESAQPQAVARSADLVDLVHGSLITINGVDYLLANHQPDGTGMSTIFLELSV
jgi:hypothetical protein